MLIPSASVDIILFLSRFLDLFLFKSRSWRVESLLELDSSSLVLGDAALFLGDFDPIEARLEEDEGDLESGDGAVSVASKAGGSTKAEKLI